MFKKTLIAAAVATLASSVAMADVVGGKVKQTFTSTDSSVAANDDFHGGTDAVLTFTGSEDLGNGMSAFADIRIDLDGTAGAHTTFDTKVGIKGGFGTVVAGRMEDFSESKVLSMVDVFSGEGVELGGSNAMRNDDAVAYVSPSFNGLTVGVAGYAMADGNGSNNGSDSFDATDIALMYANGPLTVNVAVETIDQAIADAASVNMAEKTTSFGVGYTMGNLKMAAVYQDIENEAIVGTLTPANDHNDLMLAAVYTMGNNSIAVGWNENELTTGATDNNTTSVELRHNFSARTQAFVGATQDDFATAADETDTVYMGLSHSF
jgi:predicted porin